MPTRLSLVMSGAVSLGSFHAGVLTELLYALDQLCREEKKYELDVIAGASAGSITAALVAYLVLNHAERRSDLYRAWVELPRIEDLLDGPPNNSFLSQAPIWNIARQCIAGPYTTQGRARCAPEVLRMTFTLSNLNGVNRALESSEGSFVCTFFDDRKTFLLGAQAGAHAHGRLQSVADEATWDEVKQFAVTSGAFPFAFAPALLRRARAEFDQLDPAFVFPPDGLPFTYVDGGTFNNQPLAEAVRLSRAADDGDFEQQRKYLFVNAIADTSLYDAAFLADAASGRPTTWQLGLRLAQCVFNQSRTSDWIRSLLINDQIQWRNDFFVQLVDVVQHSGMANPADFVAQLTGLAQTIVQEKQKQANARPVAGTSFDGLLTRTERKYRVPLAPVQDPNRRQVLVLLFLIMDHVADLDERKQLDLAILPPPAEGLAGAQLQGFGGFFKLEWRRYNFWQGRRVAAVHLQNVLGGYPLEEGIARDNGNPPNYAIPPEWGSFPRQTLKDTDRAPRERFRDLVVARARDLASGVRPAWWIPTWVVQRALGGYVSDQMTRLLELDR